MADGENTKPQDERDAHVPASDHPEPGDVQIDIELRDSLPGGRAFIAVEQDGAVTWLADRTKVPAQAALDLLAEMRSMVSGHGWTQNWSRAR